MDKKCKQRPKNNKDEKKVNKTKKIKDKKDKRIKLEKKVKKEIKKEEEIKEKEKEKEKEEDKNKKLLEKIYKVKYVSVCVGNEECQDGVETFRENGEKVDPYDWKVPLYYGNFHFTVDVDTGRILDWPDSKLYVKVNMRAIDTGSYDFYDKDDNKIYEEQGYVPDFLGISSPAYGDDICFDTDANGFILDWKEKNIKEQIIKHLRKYLLDEFDID